MSQRIFWIIITVLGLAFVGTTTALVVTLASDSGDETAIETAPRPGRVRGRVYDDYGNMVTAGIIVEDENGNQERLQTNYLGGYTLRLPPGEYRLHFTRGMQYSIVTEDITVESFKTYVLNDVRLVRLFDSRDYGYYPGDLHHHSTWSDGADDVDSVLLSHLSNTLYFGFLTDHNTASGLAEWMQGDRFAVDMTPTGDPVWFSPFLGNEVTTLYGHFNALGTGIVIPEWDIDVSKGDIPIEEVSYIADEIRRSGAVSVINHPFSRDELGFYFWEILDEFDAIEIWNGVYSPHGRENVQVREYWYGLLNDGRFFPAVSGSDNHSVRSPYNPNWLPANPTDDDLYHDDFLKMGRYTGMPSFYARIPDGTISLENVQYALMNGHGFMSNGILLFADVDGAEYGDTHSLNGNTTANLNLTAFGREGIDVIRIIHNGVVVEEIDVNAERHYENIIVIDSLEPGDWIVLESEGPMARYAITNPIFFD